MNAVALLLALASHAPPDVDLLASVAWVRAENDGAGTGFVVDAGKRLLVTCRHVVADRKTVDVIFPWVRGGELVTDRAAYLGNRALLRERGLLVAGKVLKTADEFDLALVELESLPAGTRAVTFARARPPGEPLTVVGNRLDLETVFNLTRGPMRVGGTLANGYFWRGKKLAANADVLVGQLPTEEGDSGGPVFDARGRLVGMASALRRQCPLAAVCISAKEIWAFAGLPAPLEDKPEAGDLAEALTRATVWVRPTATDAQVAGVLLEPDLVLTCGRKFTPGDRVGVALPLRDADRWVTERAAYRDPLDLRLRGAWRSALVLATDRDRDLTLLKLDAPVKDAPKLVLAPRHPALGDTVHTMSHPGGLEFAWVYAGGPVRQRGHLTVSPDDRPRKVSVLVCQLPAQAGSPGGALLNDRGELVGVLSARESAQLVGYAVAAEEIASFLDVALTDRRPMTLAGLAARIEGLPARFARSAALGSAVRAEALRRNGEGGAALRECDTAVSLDPGCVPARVCRARLLDAAGKPTEALAELDEAVARGPFDRGVLLLRAEWSAQAKDWRKARGSLERVLDADPADADARQRLVGVLLELGEDSRAAAAVGDTLRADPKRLPGVVADLLAQADAMAAKYPDVPSVPAGWVLKAVTAAKRPELADPLKRAAAAKDDTERLAVLRDALKKLK
ncbi:serine protease : Serine protease OS=Rhodopirellula sallentina SM41 GN=RSSM_03987 PE=4 SV=1: Trypsin_2: Trypsin_2: TPR_15 [Gemmataceae bacterium]|nr:serine protease : Serine protease OS=Rhodopirellula sallentina SM41 GN=RSSM_03987 PE=4 SV=1: Trypsin_2: Trypsin_2: TPR_15 [Gemmataceae bacterium]VTT97964.1 serine protease : Serine protease OS=Rhodopirellula sallentina SM41 GN=RSSM_03987 PE=4 SV=1: Trypsin_2: Trypsin_2: TPR_15 [Gemmataceae bacterium]